MNEWFIVGILIVLMIAQNIFWAKICLKLTNRIMSRNYAELRQAEQTPVSSRPLQEEEVDLFAEKQARELNSMLGMV